MQTNVGMDSNVLFQDNREKRGSSMTNKIGKKRKITFWTRLGFGMGGMLNSGALSFTHSYMVLFLSTECGLSAGEAARSPSTLTPSFAR